MNGIIDGGFTNPQGQQKPQVNIIDQPNLKCKECEGILFREVCVVKKISKILIPGSPTDQTVQIPVLQCVNCFELLEESIPPGLI